jgi:hypothetical protein
MVLCFSPKVNMEGCSWTGVVLIMKSVFVILCIVSIGCYCVFSFIYVNKVLVFWVLYFVVLIVPSGFHIRWCTLIFRTIRLQQRDHSFRYPVCFPSAAIMALHRNVLKKDDILCELYADTHFDVSDYSDNESMDSDSDVPTTRSSKQLHSTGSLTPQFSHPFFLRQTYSASGGRSSIHLYLMRNIPELWYHVLSLLHPHITWGKTQHLLGPLYSTKEHHSPHHQTDICTAS